MDMIADTHPVARTAGAIGADRRHALGGEYLAFRLGAQEYGIDILGVQEIRSYEQPTRITNAPVFVKGVVNLRGVIVPIVDLRLKLGCAKAEYNHYTVVVVLNLRGRVVGAVVDSVSDVLELGPGQIRPVPEAISSAGAGANFVTGIAAVKGVDAERMLMLMDIEALMGSAETGFVPV